MTRTRERTARNRRSFVMTASDVHPLDRKVSSFLRGLEAPEQNYHRQVHSALWGVVQGVEGVSEKNFEGQELIGRICDLAVRSPEAEKIIQRFAANECTPAYCAESVYDQVIKGR